MSSIDYKSLNRQTNLTVQQKAALKKIFIVAEKAVAERTPSLVGVVVIHRAMGGAGFNGDEKHDIQALFKQVRIAIATDDSKRDLSQVIGSFRMGGNKRKIIRNMANQLLDQIV